MASKLILTTVILLVLLCLHFMRETSDYSSAYAGFRTNVAGLKEIRNRKVLSTLKDKQTTLKVRLQGSSSIKHDEKAPSWELRKVPSGPDPLHHNGGSPKKPETP
ncbi:protein CLAVATA 3 [Gastrolobium bilobum]|uniref:protein CLAVATA 3 n=1 Tax=Gastrolobium bilobum TaxID=150636 RepID=UPI002AAF28AD|nr:protein CLAVATA 3 [Gastrolobium bilobum]